MRTDSLKNRFESKIEKTSSCWLWKGALTRGGYGHIRYKRKDGWCMLRSNRAAWIIYNGEIPKNKHVCHTCDNVLCVNPEHLWLGSNLDNTKDKCSKGRHNWGIKSKINKEIAAKIRQTSGTNKQIGKLFNISATEVSLIKNNKRWKTNQGDE